MIRDYDGGPDDEHEGNFMLGLAIGLLVSLLLISPIVLLM